MEPPITFGDWVRQRRTELRLTRDELAGRVGCSVSTLRKIEDGERRPSGQIAELMANSLDVPPADRSTFVRVARGELNVDRLAPASRLLAGAGARPATSFPRVNLPVLPTPLIGRQREVEELSRLLHDPQCRLLTLAGPGGIGKTRLAIEVASRVEGAFTDGVYFVPLASVTSTRYVVPAIGNAVGFGFQSGGPADPKAQLFGHLREKHALLVTDNLEHLLSEPGVEILAELLAHAPHVKLLATSRESSGLQGEWVYEVRGLPVPASDGAEEDGQDTSVELFLQRARRAHVDFNASAQDYPAIVRICELVDGMPLGIELAAAWVRTLACDEIAREIERGLGFLSISARDLPARHRSMRAVFEHSWSLLSEEEQGVLVRLSVFRGGFRRDAAEAVAGATLSVLSAFVTKSLIRRSSTGRYDLHELIRQFATAHLVQNPTSHALTRARHGEFYLSIFGEEEESLRSDVQKSVLDALVAEMDNFRVAWSWSTACSAIPVVCWVARPLWHLYELRGWFDEGEAIFLEAAEALRARALNDGSPGPALTAASVMLAHSAYFSFRLGKSSAAYKALVPCVAQLRTGADPTAAVIAMWYLGIVCWELGRYDEANETLHECLSRAREHGQPWYETLAGEFIGIIAHDRGEFELARSYLTDALAVARGLGGPMLIAHILSYMSPTLEALGETLEAERLLQESLVIAREIQYRPGIGHALEGLGRLAQLIDPGEAQILFAASRDVYQEVGDLRSLARVLGQHGHNSLLLGDEEGARASYLAVLHLVRDGGYAPIALDALAGLATMWATRPYAERALELVNIILQNPAATHEARSRAESLRADLLTELNPQQIEATRARAAGQDLVHVIDRILAQAH